MDGEVVGVRDCGSVAQVTVRTGKEVLVLAAEGKLMRQALEACGSLQGRTIEFELTEWPGGLAWFRPLDEESSDGYE